MTMTTTFLYAGYLRRYSAAPVSDDLICTGMSPTSVSIVISTPFKSASGPAIAAPLNHLGFFACSSLRAFSVLFSVARPSTICENAMAQSPLSSATVTRVCIRTSDILSACLHQRWRSRAWRLLTPTEITGAGNQDFVEQNMPTNALGSRLENARPISNGAGKFKSPEEELAYLRERVAQKERELEVPVNKFESDRIAKKEIAAYGDVPAAKVLHETVVMPEHETVRHLLKLEPEAHDKQLDGLLEIVSQRGIRNALSVVARMKNPHLEDDFHRALVRYVAEGLPQKGLPVPEKVKHALELVLFEIQPQAHGEGTKEEARQAKLEQLLSSSEQLYAGLSGLAEHGEGFLLEIAVPEGSEEATLYLAIPRLKKTLAERLISSVFPNARISESRGDYNIFNFNGHHAGAYATFANHPAFPLKTPDMFEHDPMNVLLASFAKLAKHGEGAAVQITVSSEGDRYNHHYKKMIREIEKGKPLRQALKVAETQLGEALHDVAKQLFSPKAHGEDKEREFKRGGDQLATEEIGRKVKTRILPASIRLVTSAPDQKRAEELLSNLIAPFSQYDNAKGNHLVFKHVGSWSITKFLRDAP